MAAADPQPRPFENRFAAAWAAEPGVEAVEKSPSAENAESHKKYHEDAPDWTFGGRARCFDPEIVIQKSRRGIFYSFVR